MITKQCDCCETNTIKYDLVYADDDDKSLKNISRKMSLKFVIGVLMREKIINKQKKQMKFGRLIRANGLVLIKKDKQ